MNLLKSYNLQYTYLDNLLLQIQNSGTVLDCVYLMETDGVLGVYGESIIDEPGLDLIVENYIDQPIN
jgi:hypothetical protein